MKDIEIYYIKGYGKESTCKRLYVAEIGCKVVKSMVYVKAIGVVSSALAIPPVTCMVGLGVCQGFVSAARNSIGL